MKINTNSKRSCGRRIGRKKCGILIGEHAHCGFCGRLEHETACDCTEEKYRPNVRDICICCGKACDKRKPDTLYVSDSQKWVRFLYRGNTCFNCNEKALAESYRRSKEAQLEEKRKRILDKQNRA